MLDKFIGDAIMAAFGLPRRARRRRRSSGPRRHRDDPLAVRVELVQRVADGRQPINMGIGLNTDTVVVGNIGSTEADGLHDDRRRREPRGAARGRLQGYRARILISEHTHPELSGVYRTREVDRVVVKGKTEPVAVLRGARLPHRRDVPAPDGRGERFRDGVDATAAGEWDAAIGSFRRCLQAHPGDPLSATYVDRCEQLRADPPERWDGIWVMTSK